MKLTDLKIFLDGASSTLEIYPTSSVKAELERLYALTSKRARSGGTCIAARPSVSVCVSDRAALENDWRNISGDFLHALEKERKEAKRMQSPQRSCLGY